MPPAEEGPVVHGRVVVWRVGDTLLAAPLEATVEIAPVAEGEAVSRAGRLPLRSPPGLDLPAEPRRAVVVRAGGKPMAMAADQVEGVLPYAEGDTAPTPGWLGRLPTRHLDALIRLDDARIAALLALDTLPGQ